MADVVWLLLPAASIIYHLLVPFAAAGADNTAVPSSPSLPAPRPNCPRKCGDVDIPYPYGIGDGCSWRGLYSLTCNHSFNPPRPYEGNVEVLGLSLETGEMRVLASVSSRCYKSYNATSQIITEVNTILMVSSQLLISTTRNEFTATGCNTVALLSSSSYYTGCITSCVSVDAAAQDGDKCTGLGCCQTSIPGNLSNIAVAWGKPRNSNSVWRYSPCSNAFVAEKGWYDVIITILLYTLLESLNVVN
jgi:hypothetical protein